MAGRCGPCHGILAGALPRLPERRAAGLVGAWLRVIGARLRLPVRPDRVAGLLWIGILPALVVVWIRFYVNEPEVWVENRRQQREIKAEVKAPLFSIFKRGLLFNTLTACFWIASTFCVYYSIWALFSAYLQKELNWTPLMVATPVFWANIVVFAGN